MVSIYKGDWQAAKHFNERGLLPLATATAIGSERIDLFPDYFFVMCDLENPSRSALGNQRVAVEKAFSAADVVAVERDEWIAGVLPGYLVVTGVYLDDTRERSTHVVRAVVENQHVPVVQIGRIMLVGDLSRSPFPGEFATGPVHDAHGAGLAKADQHGKLH